VFAVVFAVQHCVIVTLERSRSISWTRKCGGGVGSVGIAASQRRSRRRGRRKKEEAEEDEQDNSERKRRKTKHIADTPLLGVLR